MQKSSKRPSTGIGQDTKLYSTTTAAFVYASITSMREHTKPGVGAVSQGCELQGVHNLMSHVPLSPSALLLLSVKAVEAAAACG
jgi:hypothetical protein